jgi:hypothetical protein
MRLFFSSEKDENPETKMLPKRGLQFNYKTDTFLVFNLITNITTELLTPQN